jgi:hypothetical protein
MVWFVITLIFSTILDIITRSHQPTLEKDLEILVLCQQISILHRKLNSPIRPSRVEKLTQSVLTMKLKKLANQPTSQLRNFIRSSSP